MVDVVVNFLITVPKSISVLAITGWFNDTKYSIPVSELVFDNSGFLNKSLQVIQRQNYFN